MAPCRGPAPLGVGALEEEKGAGAGGLGAARIGGPLRWDAAEA